MGEKNKQRTRDMGRAAMGSVGWRVRELREARKPKMAQGVLAKAAGITVQSVSDLERGITKGPKPEHLFAFAECLDVNPFYLATGKGPKDPIKNLSPIEGELLLMFRQLEPEDRAQVLGFVRGLQRKKAPLAIVPPETREAAG